MRQAVSRTQMWVRARMPVYGLNQTLGLVPYKGDKSAARPPEGWPSRSWGPIRPRVCSWFRAPIRHECQTAQLKSRGRAIYLSLPPTRHDLTQGQKPEGLLKWDKGEGKVGKEPRLEPCLSVLLIGSLSAMWAWWGKQFHEPKCESGHVCQFTA